MARQLRVVIIGAGFAGWQVAQQLANSNFDVVLIDRQNYHTLTAASTNNMLRGYPANACSLFSIGYQATAGVNVPYKSACIRLASKSLPKGTN